MAKNWKYGKGEAAWVNTDALRKYVKDTGMSLAEVGKACEDTEKAVHRWLQRSRVPRVVLEKLGITVRGPYKQRADKKTVSSIPAGGTIYACYVGAAEKTAFLAFCAAMHISAKDMI